MAFSLAPGSHQLLTCCSLPLTKGRGTAFLPQSGSPVPLPCYELGHSSHTFPRQVGWILPEPKAQKLQGTVPWTPALGGVPADGFLTGKQAWSYSGLKGDWLVVVGPEPKPVGAPTALQPSRSSGSGVESCNVALPSNQSTFVLSHCYGVIPKGHHLLLK